MEWDLLRTFEAVARLGSLTAAAKALGVSQSTVSRQLTKLEQDAGSPLLLRDAPLRTADARTTGARTTGGGSMRGSREASSAHSPRSTSGAAGRSSCGTTRACLLGSSSGRGPFFGEMLEVVLEVVLGVLVPLASPSSAAVGLAVALAGPGPLPGALPTVTAARSTPRTASKVATRIKGVMVCRGPRGRGSMLGCPALDANRRSPNVVRARHIGRCAVL